MNNRNWHCKLLKSYHCRKYSNGTVLVGVVSSELLQHILPIVLTATYVQKYFFIPYYLICFKEYVGKRYDSSVPGQPFHPDHRIDHLHRGRSTDHQQLGLLTDHQQLGQHTGHQHRSQRSLNQVTVWKVAIGSLKWSLLNAILKLNPEFPWLCQIVTTLSKFHWWFWIFWTQLPKLKN